MEEAKAYIESGILELYVLGQLNDQEQREVEAMAAKHPEVKQEIEAIEIAMEQYAVAQAIEPSKGLDLKIFEKIDLQQNQQSITDIPVNQNAELPIQKPQERTEAQIVPLNTGTDSKIRTLRVALAACIALLIVSVIALFSAHNELGDARNQIASLSADKQQFTSTVNFMKQNNSDLQKIIAMGNDPDWKTVKLAGTPMDPAAKMTVYWHVSGKHVMMDNSKMDLPVNDKDHQYQLWALVNGKPVDLGVFDVKPDTSSILVNMKEIASAQTFAVTLEKRGGSPSPTMNQMIVAGNVI
ncbi:anti-sigma factor [Pedobacter frigoris]|uniref:Regulator of SigK n=1 Tax=Pedobacter frigoris TaxID=2571272 RepID=A0A4U1CPE5_9SPHI|nr:anti-sigma factor [Pedobacter frigoris]TKC07345.1 anti-sigma factor [Pedobacter frigoris]